LQSEITLRSNVTKSLLKGTVAIAAFSVFLEIQSHFLSYLIFLAISYSSVGLYMIFKESTIYEMDESGITIKRPFRADLRVPFENVRELSVSQGILAKRFECGTLYIELKKGKGSHTSSTGRGVYVLKDIPHPQDVSREIADKVGPFAPSP
jgi:PH (Pleckstrin Homology) domain-containing protein